MEATRVYEGFATCMSQVYFTLEELAESHYLYQFSLPFFLQLVADTLDQKTNKAFLAIPEKDRSNHDIRLRVIKKSMFNMLFKRVGRGLLQKDQVAFALRLAQISLQSESKTAVNYHEMQFLLKVS